MFRRLALFSLILILGFGLSPSLGRGQADPAFTPRPVSSGARATPSTRTAVAPQQSDPALGSPPAAPVPQIVVTPSPAQPATWTWHDRCSGELCWFSSFWATSASCLSLQVLKNIQRQTEFGVSAAQAALQCANAALESSQAIVDSGRPWIVVTVEPFLTVEHGFKVMATNRGRTPARILAKADCVKVASDETKLPATPDFDSGKSATPFEPIILLPGESAGIRPFRRADVRAYCASDEQFKRVEKWEEKLFMYGRVIYRDLISPAGSAES